MYLPGPRHVVSDCLASHIGSGECDMFDRPEGYPGPEHPGGYSANGPIIRLEFVERNAVCHHHFSDRVCGCLRRDQITNRPKSAGVWSNTNGGPATIYIVHTT